jgi:phosphohistidine phosphatase
VSRVYLVRHGEAGPDPDDAARVLTTRGREAVEAVALRLRAAGLEVAEIRHSGLARARQTADVLARHLAPARGVAVMEGLGPDDDPRRAATALASAADPVMLVGHLPHLARLAGLLLGGDRAAVRFEPGTALGLGRGPDGWVLDWMLPPRLAAERPSR